MALVTIASIDDYFAAVRQPIEYARLNTRTTVSGGWYTLADLGGQPGGVTLTHSASSGVKPTDSDPMYPSIASFAGGASGILGRWSFGWTVAGRIYLFDRLAVYGSYLYTYGNPGALSSQPAISDRCPDYPGSGSVFGDGTELWMEFSTALVTGSAFGVTVTYTNSAGVGSRSTGAFAVGAAANGTIGRAYQMPLQAGDTGIQKIESVAITHTGMTAGAINLMILRPLAQGRISVVNQCETQDVVKLGLPVVYDSSAIYPLYQLDATSSGSSDMTIEIASK
jgi:hypothetical protein